jgi:hypothetical protein
MEKCTAAWNTQFGLFCFFLVFVLIDYRFEYVFDDTNQQHTKNLLWA